MMDKPFAYRNPEAADGAGPLSGLKVAIQPNISKEGWPTEAGSKALTDFKALKDATIVRRLLGAGAYICGSTRMSEFGFGLDGSSAGEAVQHKDADVELVLDLMGESRLAAGRASVCGFKPSYGLISRLGLVGLIPSMECYGMLSENIKNIRDMLKAVAGPDEMDFSLPDEKTPDFSAQKIDPKKTTIGFITEAQASLSAGRQKTFRSVVEELKKSGFTVREVSLPDFPLFSLVHMIVGSVEASSCAGRYDSVRYGPRAAGAKNWNEMYLLSRGAAFGLLLKSYLIQGAYFQFERYEAFENACRIRARLIKQMQHLASEAEFLAFPMDVQDSTQEPASLAGTYAQFSSTLYANITGQPALYLPPVSGTSQTGFQLAGPRLSDGRLLALGEHILNTRRGGK